MAEYEHLRLVKMPQQFERRKKPGFGSAPSRNNQQRITHGTSLITQLDSTVAYIRSKRRPGNIDPSLIMKVKYEGSAADEDWERLGLHVLSHDEDKTLVLFSSNDSLLSLKERINAYSGPIPANQRNPAYNNFVGNLTSIEQITATDRIGIRLREEGFVSLDHFDENESYIIDIELWEFGGRIEREAKVESIKNIADANGGEFIDSYIGPSISLLRIKCDIESLKEILEIPEVYTIDFPPSPDTETSTYLDIDIENAPEVNDAYEDLPIIGVIDSGVNNHPFLDGALIGGISFLSDDGEDILGHGTSVAGIAAFGDFRNQFSSGNQLTRYAKICSAKVVNNEGKFPDEIVIPKLMSQAINALHERFGCRIFNISLGDPKAPFNGKRNGQWASILDDLARSLDILIIVSAGNGNAWGSNPEDAINEYPHFLVHEKNRFLEPAGAVNAITVGSLSCGDGLPPSLAPYVGVQPTAKMDEPSIFTRTGPGVLGICKPDMVDYGGTAIYDSAIPGIRSGGDISEAGMISLNNKFLTSLLKTSSGTSVAAPMVAHKAAILLKQIPDCTANLLRALLINSSTYPEINQQRINILDEISKNKIYGKGIPKLRNLISSEDNRVVLYSEDSLQPDYFSVYEIPITDIFKNTAGKKNLKITLTFDPPVRHTRKDYLGCEMNFRLIRGKTADEVFDFFKVKEANDNPSEMSSSNNCDLKPGANSRDFSTVQTASVTYDRAMQKYGDTYYLVVRCQAGWADFIQTQRYAIVVEMTHAQDINIYQTIQQRIQPRIQPRIQNRNRV
ncbi:S8 family peptidase [Klebsiella pneumoniae]|uniref:S8 family peptidase n=1 Tax=Klebsiella pneumoniae TaxID=573 RepID=UPI000B9BD71E|nr:S8 family peptidase [Klebsiella pneumoniae]HBR6775821.1 S8 family peptidase [Klebsiella pneumoniae]